MLSENQKELLSAYDVAKEAYFENLNEFRVVASRSMEASDLYQAKKITTEEFLSVRRELEEANDLSDVFANALCDAAAAVGYSGIPLDDNGEPILENCENAEETGDLFS